MFFYTNASHAFRRGFGKGFSSAFRVAAGERAHFSYHPRPTDADAWREVGDLLNEANRLVGQEVVKEPRKAPSPRKKQSA